MARRGRKESAGGIAASEEGLALGSRPDLRFRTKQQYVYQSLRDAIVRGELAPGRRLVIDDIGRQLKVSAIPIREALQLLQSEGLVESAPHVGATVSLLSEGEVHEVFAILEGLETVAVREAARSVDDAGAATLATLVADMDTTLQARDYERWAALNVELHRAIGGIARMPLLREMTERVLSRWERLRRHYFQGVLVPRLEQAQREHRALVEALLRRDADLAERVVREHNRAALASYTDYLRRDAPATTSGQLGRP